MRPTILSLASSARRGASTAENQQSANPTTPSRTPRQQRIPLQSRDNNVMMRAPQKGAPLSTRSGNAMPPYDKQNGSSRPLVPTLSVSASKTVNKTPLTPRVAGSTPSLASSSLARRGARQDVNPTPAGSQKEDISTPVSAFLSNNITPRSSSRKTRVDSSNTTPTHTPTSTPARDGLRTASEAPVYGGAGLNIVGLESNASKRPSVSFSPALSELGSQKDYSKSGGNTKFFYASDAKVAVQSPQQQRPTLETKTSTFIYANGDTIPLPVRSGGSAAGSVVGSTIGEDRSQAKFFHANGTPDSSSQPWQSFSTTGSTISNSQFSAPKLAPHNPASALSSLQRPTSPPKANQTVLFPALKHSSTLPPPVLPGPQATSREQFAQDALSVKGRSTETPRGDFGHERSTSVGVLDLSPSVRGLSNPAPIMPLSPLSPSDAIIGRLVLTPEESISEVDNDADSSQSDVQSPVKAGHSLERMNVLASNARRERKVLDLEITNSSLAAINRTLEREMRKQTAELRRYRRLSRSGRLSIVTSASMRTSAGSLSIMDGVDAVPLSDMSEEDSEGDDDDEESSEEESVDDGSLSPNAMAENDARHRKKDEKRLLLDLSKHQQLLVDSQNMNQSLKRCLGWTEELINEGKKALAYHVRVSDIELGGRVLAPDEVEDIDNEGSFGIDASIVEGNDQSDCEIDADAGYGHPTEEHTVTYGKLSL